MERSLQGPGAVRRSFLDGALAMSPILLGVAPFAFVAGAISVNDGASPAQAVALSLLAFAGASQIAAFNLLAAGASVAAAVTTATVINLRFLLYSAAISPVLSMSSARTRLAGAYLLADHAFAVTANDRARRDAASVTAYYFGAAIAFWVTWQSCLGVGAAVGGNLTSDLPLQFLVSLSFLALLIPMLRGSGAWTAAASAAVCMMATQHALGGAAAIASTCAGVAVGQAMSWRRRTPATR